MILGLIVCVYVCVCVSQDAEQSLTELSKRSGDLEKKMVALRDSGKILTPTHGLRMSVREGEGEGDGEEEGEGERDVL